MTTKTSNTAARGPARKKRTAKGGTTQKKTSNSTNTKTSIGQNSVADSGAEGSFFVTYLPSFDKEWGPLAKAHICDAGFDLRTTTIAQIHPGEIRKVRCGIKIALPLGFEAQVRPRSGLASQGLTVINAPGTIDAGYRGEIIVFLINLGDKVKHFQPGDRIAQMIIAPIAAVMEFTPVEDLPDSDRGEAGFGSTGTK